jgi:hypothetical protein
MARKIKKPFEPGGSAAVSHKNKHHLPFNRGKKKRPYGDDEAGLWKSLPEVNHESLSMSISPA